MIEGYSSDMLRNIANLCAALNTMPIGVSKKHGDSDDLVFIENPLPVYRDSGGKIGVVEDNGGGWYFIPDEAD